jgi:hypothetical protein
VPKMGYCRICSFFEKPYRRSEKETFEKLVRENVSLRRLEIFFTALNLRVKKDAIASHIHKCMGIEVEQQRAAEKNIKKGIEAIKKIKDWFITPEPPMLPECRHLRAYRFFDVGNEVVVEKCLDCGKILGSYSLERGQVQDHYKNLRIYEALRRDRK